MTWEAKTASLKNLLRENSVKIIFTKVNGEERVMNCTLVKDRLPVTESDKEPRDLKNTISVWDLDVNNWRSFRVDSVKSVDII